MVKQPIFTAILAASSLMAVLVGSPAMAASDLADPAWVDDLLEQMERREGVSRGALERLASTLMQAHENRDPGDYFDTYSPDEVARLINPYGQAQLAATLRDWDVSATSDSDRANIQQRVAGFSAQPSPAPGQNETSTAPVSASPAASSQQSQAYSGYSDSEFATHVMRQMQTRATLSREEVDRFESILMQGGARDVIERYGYQNAADLVAVYGLDDLSNTLASRGQVAAGSQSAAARLGSVTSAPENSGDYRDEYLVAANSHRVTGVSRYGGATLTVFDDNLDPFTLDDPIAGAQMQANVTSCLYRGTRPNSTQPQATSTMQLLDLPGTISAERFVRIVRNPGSSEDEIIIEEYELSRVALDWGAASSSRVPAYFYGNIVPPPETFVNSRGEVETRIPPPPPPEWQVFACSPRAISSS